MDGLLIRGVGPVDKMHTQIQEYRRTILMAVPGKRRCLKRHGSVARGALAAIAYSIVAMATYDQALAQAQQHEPSGPATGTPRRAIDLSREPHHERRAGSSARNTRSRDDLPLPHHATLRTMLLPVRRDRRRPE